MVDSASAERDFDERTTETMTETDERIVHPFAARRNTEAEIVQKVALAPVEALAPAQVAPTLPAATEPVRIAKRNWKRPLLFALLPIALVAGGYEYVTGGAVMSTDNAYVQSQMLGLSTDVSGTVSAIEVHNNQSVKKGQVMFRLRPDSFQIALDGAQAQLGTVRNQVLTLQASYKETLAQIEQAKADIPYYETGFKRQQDLMASGSAARSSFDQAQHDLTSARQRLIVSQAQAASMLAQLGNDANQSVEQNPFYLQSKSLVDNAQRDLNDTVVRAPFDGIVTNVDALQVGAYLPAAQQGFTLVSSEHRWIDASPKETELTWVEPGQTATITADSYPGVTWEGKVESINPASGASFSLLPAQNTSGNWVKVVQRIPMRIQILSTAGKPPLRMGMSVVVDVQTGHARGIPEALKPLVAFAQPYVQQARTFAERYTRSHG